MSYFVFLPLALDVLPPSPSMHVLDLSMIVLVYHVLVAGLQSLYLLFAPPPPLSLSLSPSLPPSCFSTLLLTLPPAWKLTVHL